MFSAARVHTGLSFEVGPDFMLLAKPKSGSDFLLGAGVIDPGYQGEILIKVVNYTPSPLTIPAGVDPDPDRHGNWTISRFRERRGRRRPEPAPMDQRPKDRVETKCHRALRFCTRSETSTAHGACVSVSPAAAARLWRTP